MRILASLLFLLTFSDSVVAEPVSVRSDFVGAEITRNAAISSLKRLPEGVAIGIQAQTAIAGLKPEGETQVADVDSGGKEYTRRFSDGTHRCIVKDRFIPSGTSIRWEIEILGEGEPWSAPIETRLAWPVTHETVFWTAWSDPLHEKGPWHDALVFRPLDDMTFWYGAPPFDEKKPLTGYCPLEGDTFCMPLITVGEPARDEAFSVVLSPEDDLLDLTLRVEEQGGIVFSRLNYRIAPDRPLRFALDLVPHAADWRSALAWMVGRYPQYFDPPNPAADEMAGTAAYSSYEGEMDVAKCMRMSFRVNWKASFDFPYMGMFLPPVANDTEKWPRFAPGETSVKQMNDYAQRMRDMGFYVFSYFNVTEFGTDIKGPETVNADSPENELWRNATNFLYRKIPDGVLHNEAGGTWGTWGGAIAMDPAGPAYQAHLLEQARRHVAELPAASGVCIDRLDWLRFYNPREDDGLSWRNGKAMRSLFQSWKGIIAKLDPIFHEAGKVIFVNNHLKRLELLRYVDGIYCEFAHVGTALNGSGLLGLRKPVLGWTADVSNLKPDPDGFLQRYLHMGVYPTAPLAGNDHTIGPDPWAEQYYMDYGKLFDAIRGKKWVLEPHVIEVVDNKAKTNLFEIPERYAIPVTFGGSEQSVTVRLRNLPKLPGQSTLVAEVIHPGEANWQTLAVNEQEGVITLNVPLQRGCAMVQLMSAKQGA